MPVNLCLCYFYSCAFVNSPLAKESAFTCLCLILSSYPISVLVCTPVSSCFSTVFVLLCIGMRIPVFSPRVTEAAVQRLLGYGAFQVDAPVTRRRCYAAAAAASVSNSCITITVGCPTHQQQHQQTQQHRHQHPHQHQNPHQQHQHPAGGAPLPPLPRWHPQHQRRQRQQPTIQRRQQP